MSATRYRVSFRDPEAPGGWVQGVADGCLVRITRKVSRHSFRTFDELVIDEVPLADAAACAEGMSTAEIALTGIHLYDERFYPWVEARMHAQAGLCTVVVAQFDGLDADDMCEGDWQGWAQYAHAVASARAALIEAQWMWSRTTAYTEGRRLEGTVTLVALELHRSQELSPLVPPLDLLPGTIFYPYVPLQISSVWPADKEKP